MGIHESGSLIRLKREEAGPVNAETWLTPQQKQMVNQEVSGRPKAPPTVCMQQPHFGAATGTHPPVQQQQDNPPPRVFHSGAVHAGTPVGGAVFKAPAPPPPAPVRIADNIRPPVVDVREIPKNACLSPEGLVYARAQTGLRYGYLRALIELVPTTQVKEETVFQSDEVSTVFIKGLPYTLGEREWIPRLLTFGGIFKENHHGVVGIKVGYKPSDRRDGEYFAGTAYICFANRNLANFFFAAWDKLALGHHPLVISVDWSNTGQFRIDRRDKANVPRLGSPRTGNLVWYYPQLLVDQGVDAPGYIPLVNDLTTVCMEKWYNSSMLEDNGFWRHHSPI